MKQRFLFRRGRGTYYREDTGTGKQESSETADRHHPPDRSFFIARVQEIRQATNMPQTAEAQSAVCRLVEPMTLQQRKARGFCTCPLRTPGEAETTPDPQPCRVHPKHLIHSAEHNRSHRLLFFDDCRNRYVTWEDAVEGMRQPRYAGATSKGLVLYTWMNLIRLLEALCDPTREPAAEITEQSAERLIKLAGQDFPPDELNSLIHFARGGETEALCKILRTVARNAQAGGRANREGAP